METRAKQRRKKSTKEQENLKMQEVKNEDVQAGERRLREADKKERK